MQNTGYIIINLLPYRAKIKKEKLQRFAILLSLFVIGAGAVLFGASSFLSIQTESQLARNKYLENQNKKLDEEIKSIANLKEEIKDTLAKRRVVENLQVNRSDIVNILNELSLKLPEGVLIKSMKQSNNRITIVGQTVANSKISNYMNNLDNTPVFQNSQLVEVKIVSVLSPSRAGSKNTKVAETNRQSEFIITTELEKKIEDVVVEKNKKSSARK